MKRIVFCGFRGTGKTEIGKIVAARTGLPFLDTDTLIEQQTGRSIPDIFHEDGEERFREEERKVIAGLPAADAVICTGGGVVTDPVNMEHLRRDSTVFLLHADIDTIEARLTKKPRPPLTGLPLREEIATMMDRRRQHYHAAADFCIDTSETTPQAAAERVMDLLRKGTIPAKHRAPCISFFRTGRIPPKCMERLMQVLADNPADPLTRLMGVAGYPCCPQQGPAPLQCPVRSTTGSITTTRGSRTRSSTRSCAWHATSMSRGSRSRSRSSRRSSRSSTRSRSMRHSRSAP